jgi:hypothetical protein
MTRSDSGIPPLRSASVGKPIGGYNKTTMKALHGLLNKRNECAQPSGYSPDLNRTLGFIGELVDRIKKLQTTPRVVHEREP